MVTGNSTSEVNGHAQVDPSSPEAVSEIPEVSESVVATEAEQRDSTSADDESSISGQGDQSPPSRSVISVLSQQGYQFDDDYSDSDFFTDLEVTQQELARLEEKQPMLELFEKNQDQFQEFLKTQSQQLEQKQETVESVEPAAQEAEQEAVSSDLSDLFSQVEPDDDLKQLFQPFQLDPVEETFFKQGFLVENKSGYVEPAEQFKDRGDIIGYAKSINDKIARDRQQRAARDNDQWGTFSKMIQPYMKKVVNVIEQRDQKIAQLESSLKDKETSTRSKPQEEQPTTSPSAVDFIESELSKNAEIYIEFGEDGQVQFQDGHLVMKPLGEAFIRYARKEIDSGETDTQKILSNFKAQASLFYPDEKPAQPESRPGTETKTQPQNRLQKFLSNRRNPHTGELPKTVEETDRTLDRGVPRSENVLAGSGRNNTFLAMCEEEMARNK